MKSAKKPKINPPQKNKKTDTVADGCTPKLWREDYKSESSLSNLARPCFKKWLGVWLRVKALVEFNLQYQKQAMRLGKTATSELEE